MAPASVSMSSWSGAGLSRSGRGGGGECESECARTRRSESGGVGSAAGTAYEIRRGAGALGVSCWSALGEDSGEGGRRRLARRNASGSMPSRRHLSFEWLHPTQHVAPTPRRNMHGHLPRLQRSHFQRADSALYSPVLTTAAWRQRIRRRRIALTSLSNFRESRVFVFSHGVGSETGEPIRSQRYGLERCFGFLVAFLSSSS